MKKVLAIILMALAVTAVFVSCDDPKHEHSYGTEWKSDETNHWHECSCGEKIDVAAHTWESEETKPATCTEKGVITYTCTVCGRTKTEDIPALGHVWSLWEDVAVDTDADTPADKMPQKTRKCTRTGCTYHEEEDVITGEGTAESPLEIATPNGLILLAEACNYSDAKKEDDDVTKDGFAGKVIKLVQDIDLSGVDNWTPIGKGERSGNKAKEGSTPFKGTFDGNEHTISNLKITTGSGSDCIGLFGVLDGGTIRDLTLTNVNINVSACENVGAVVGLMINDATLDNVTVGSSDTSETSTVAALGAGGVAGRITVSGTVKNCTNYATVKGGAQGVGGVALKSYYQEEGKSISITGCRNYGSIIGSSGCVGGITSFAVSTNLTDCYNYGAVIGEGESVAGIVGEIRNKGLVEKCENKGTIINKSSGYGTGGIVGWIRYNSGSGTVYSPVEIKNNKNSGNISSSGTGVGGIVGVLYDAGKVTGNTNEAAVIAGGNMVTGIVGDYQNVETGSYYYTDGPGLTEIIGNTSSTSCALSGTNTTAIVWDNSGKITIAENTPSTDDNTDCYVVSSDGSKTYYKSFETAVSDAESGETIKLLSDLNLTSYAKDTFHAYVFKDNVTLDLNTHSITSKSGGVCYEGNITIQNGKFICDNGSYALFIGDDDLENHEKHTTVLKNIATEDGGINVCSHKVVIESGDMAGSSSTVEGTKYYALWADENAEVTVKGGTYTSPSTLGNAVVGATKATKGKEGKITISGGTIKADGNVNLFLINSSDKSDKNYKPIVVDGGTFSKEPAGEYLASGYKAIKNSDGLWEVEAENK